MVTPIASYSFDENDGDILDRSGHNNDFALNNNLLRAAEGQNNFGVTKNDVGMPVLCEPSFLVSDYWTIMFSQKGTASTGTWWIRLYSEADDTGSGILNLGGLRARIRKNGSNFQSDPVAIPSDDEYHHYTITYDGTVGSLYIDATLVGTTPVAALPITSHNRIDMMEFSVANTVVDNLRFFDMDLSQEQIENYMNSPVVDDTTSSQSIFIWNGTNWAGTSKKIWNNTSWVDTP